MNGHQIVRGLGMVALAALAFAVPAEAGFPDGQGSIHLWTVPGVIRRNGMVTTFICTNIGPVAADIGVQVFDDTGTPQNDFSVAPAPGTCNGAILNVPSFGTVSIAVSGTAQLHEDCIISMGSLLNGSAKIFSNSKRVACNALVIDRANVVEDPGTGLPTGVSPSLTSLKVIRAKKQFGD